MKKRTVLILVLASAVIVIGIACTVAYLVASSNRVENTFTTGDVKITLTETTGTEYKLAPGVTLTKDPTVTVKKGSDSCWVFVEIKKNKKLDNFCTFEIENGWTQLTGLDGVYYLKADKARDDLVFKVLKDDMVQVSESVTEEMLKTIGTSLDLDITAYAVQSAGIDSPEDAWNALNS